MAQKRMFDKSILETDNFLNISLTAKALYFLLGMEADDEGFISPKRVIRLYGGELGDLKNLIDTGLVIPFKSGVIVITDWNQNNWLDNRRIRPTQYQEEKKMLVLTEQKKYELSNRLASAQPVESSIEESSIEEKSIVAPQAVRDNKEIERIIDLFKAVSPLTYSKFFAIPPERSAAAELATKLPEGKIEVLILDILPQINVLSYVPKDCKAFKPTELLRNLDRVMTKAKEIQIKRSGNNKRIEIV